MIRRIHFGLFQILEELWITGKRGSLKNFEIPQRIYLEGEPFTVENNKMTISEKVKKCVQLNSLLIIFELKSDMQTKSRSIL
jgi:hypothetical protein